MFFKKAVCIVLVVAMITLTGCATTGTQGVKDTSELGTYRVVGTGAGAATGFVVTLGSIKTNTSIMADPEMKSWLSWASLGLGTALSAFLGWVAGDMVYSLTHNK